MSDITMEDLFVAIKELSNDVAKGNERLGNLETKVESIETRVESIETRIESIETRVENIEFRVERLETRVERMETEMKKMRGDMRRMNYKFNDYINDLADSKARLTMLEKEIGMEW